MHILRSLRTQFICKSLTKTLYITFFCLYLMASLSLARCIRSVPTASAVPAPDTGPLVSWLSIVSSSFDPLVWSSKAVAKVWHCLDKVSYSDLNSFSSRLSLFSSHESSNAVSIGSLLDNAISDGLAKARYALMRDREWFKRSSLVLVTHSVQLHLTSWGLAIRSPRSNRILMIS